MAQDVDNYKEDYCENEYQYSYQGVVVFSLKEELDQVNENINGASLNESDVFFYSPPCLSSVELAKR